MLEVASKPTQLEGARAGIRVELIRSLALQSSRQQLAEDVIYIHALVEPERRNPFCSCCDCIVGGGVLKMGNRRMPYVKFLCMK